MAGRDGGRDFVVETNLVGAYRCFEHAARQGAQVVFLSTSRVYPVAKQEELRWEEEETRFSLSDEQDTPGASAEGISEEFPLDGVRTLYGATKLAAEHLLLEYGDLTGIDVVINRFGVIAGPWQMGKVDQGVFTWWALAHHFGRPLSYIGFGGTGKQVRDLIHVADAAELVEEQLANSAAWNGVTVNVGGGRDGSLSLLETTALCRELTGNRVEIQPVEENRPGDVRIYLSDCSKLHSFTDWRPSRPPDEIMRDIVGWIAANESGLGRLLSRG